MDVRFPALVADALARLRQSIIDIWSQKEMERWCGVVRANLNPSNTNRFSVAASLCLSPYKNLTAPSANAIFFTGDQVKGSGNPVVERLSDPQNIAQILVSKFADSGLSSVNVWVVEPATFNGPFAVYDEFIPSVNSRGDPKSYTPDGFPASTSVVLLLSKCLEQVKQGMLGGKQKTPQTEVCTSSPHQPNTIIFGFSKGGTVLNQIVTELASIKQEAPLNLFLSTKDSEIQEENQIIPNSKERFLNSISEIHYVDVGLNSTGAYLTDNSTIQKIVDRVRLGASGIRFTLHGTPRQWRDSMRPWIVNEKKRLFQMLEDAAQKTAGRIEVRERFYYANMPPSMQMHFEIIEIMDVR